MWFVLYTVSVIFVVAVVAREVPKLTIIDLLVCKHWKVYAVAKATHNVIYFTRLVTL